MKLKLKCKEQNDPLKMRKKLLQESNQFGTVVPQILISEKTIHTEITSGDGDEWFLNKNFIWDNSLTNHIQPSYFFHSDT